MICVLRQISKYPLGSRWLFLSSSSCLLTRNRGNHQQHIVLSFSLLSGLPAAGLGELLTPINSVSWDPSDRRSPQTSQTHGRGAQRTLKTRQLVLTMDLDIPDAQRRRVRFCPLVLVKLPIVFDCCTDSNSGLLPVSSTTIFCKSHSSRNTDYRVNGSLTDTTTMASFWLSFLDIGWVGGSLTPQGGVPSW